MQPSIDCVQLRLKFAPSTRDGDFERSKYFQLDLDIARRLAAVVPGSTDEAEHPKNW
jgi:hypothetical protein